MDRDFKGIWIPKEVWLSKELTLQEKVFLVEIHSLDNKNGCFASNEYFSKFFGISKTRVSLVISSLIEKNYISSHIFENLGNKRVLKITNKFYKGYLTKVKDPDKQKLKRGLKQKLKYNNTNINNTNNNIKLHSPGSANPEQKTLKRTIPKTTKTIEPKQLTTKQKNNLRSKDFLPQATKIKQILQEKKNIEITPAQLTAWANSIRLLCDKNKISVERMDKVLTWYEKHWDDAYVPVIESGESFRTKFIKLEDAINRDKTPTKKEKQSGASFGSRRFGEKVDYSKTKYISNEKYFNRSMAD